MNNNNMLNNDLVLDEAKSLIALAKAQREGKVDSFNELALVANGANIKNREAFNYWRIGLIVGAVAGVILR